MFPHMSSESYHEPIELLSEPTKNTHRAIVSLKEELEAIDWYQQRAEACTDPELAGVLIHNKNEEVEHAMMVLEWLRRNNPIFDEHIGTYVNSSGPILEVEEMSTGGGEGGPKGEPKGGSKSDSKKKSSSYSAGSLGIGSLKGYK
jgi:uncharacterized protein